MELWLRECSGEFNRFLTHVLLTGLSQGAESDQTLLAEMFAYCGSSVAGVKGASRLVSLVVTLLVLMY